MSRFANIPCETCGKDTMHYVGKCSVCGTAREFSRWGDVLRRRAAKLHAAGYPAPVIATIMTRGTRGHRAIKHELQPTKKQRDWHEAPSKEGLFGKGRARTRV